MADPGPSSSPTQQQTHSPPPNIPLPQPPTVPPSQSQSPATPNPVPSPSVTSTSAPSTRPLSTCSNYETHAMMSHGPGMGSFSHALGTIGRATGGKDLDEEDECMSHPAVHELRESMYREAFEFLRQQRFACMLAGSWFQVPPSSASSQSTASPPSSSSTSSRGGKMARWRFCKLSGTKKTLHWADFAEQMEKKPAFTQLTERLDLSTITDLLTGLASPIHGAVSSSGISYIPQPAAAIAPSASSMSISATFGAPPPAPPPPTSHSPPGHSVQFSGLPPPPPPGPGSSSATAAPLASNSNVLNTSASTTTVFNPASQGTVRGRRGGTAANTMSSIFSSSSNTNPSTSTDLSTLCFSLMSGPDLSVLDLICTSATQFSEWTDGLNLLLSRGVSNKDTTEFIHSLTEITVRMRLLDVAADRIPLKGPGLDVPPLPPDVDFHFDDVSGVTGAPNPHAPHQAAGTSGGVRKLKTMGSGVSRASTVATAAGGNAVGGGQYEVGASVIGGVAAATRTAGQEV